MELRRALADGVNYPFEFDRVRGALLYAIQLPGIVTLPLLLLAAAGTFGLLGRLRTARPAARRHGLAIFGSVPVVGLAFVLLKLDHFPRHLVFLIPWAALAGGWYLVQVTDGLARRRQSPAWVLVPVFLWMLVFAVDSERFFLFEPRNDAYRWLRANVPEGSSVFWTLHRAPVGYRQVRWPAQEEPDVLIFDMHAINNTLSGINWRNSYPTDVRQIFDAGSAARVATIQSLFQGTSGTYTLVARFPDPYLMPEHRVAQRLLGDRARTYISEVVIFRRTGARPVAAASGTG
jgi:hypothetical protein